MNCLRCTDCYGLDISIVPNDLFKGMVLKTEGGHELDGLEIGASLYKHLNFSICDVSAVVL